MAAMEEGLSAFGLDPETLGAAPGPPSSTAYVLLETPDNDGFPAAVLQGEGFLLPLVASQGPTGSRIPCPDPPTSSTTFQHGKREVVVKPIGKVRKVVSPPPPQSLTRLGFPAD